jgi:hypothetical protein
VVFVLDIDRVADQVLRLGGPYTVEAVSDAAGLLAELVRRLNHATLGWVAATTVDSLVARLSLAVGAMPQLCCQLGESLQWWATSPDLATDKGSLDPAEVAGDAALELADAGLLLTGVWERLRQAHNHTAHLYERGEQR